MDRDVIYSTEQLRSWDFVIAEFYAMVALAQMFQDVMGRTITVVGGLAAHANGTDLVVRLAAGSIYQQAAADASAIGAIAANSQVIQQQGIVGATNLTLSTAGITGGQSRYTLIQAQFAQIDDTPSNDPTGGAVPFYNSSDPTSPIFSTVDTARQGLVVFSVKNGAAAATNSQVPPAADAGWVGLYLISLAFGQTTISTGNIITCGPSAALNVPSNYPVAPFLAGLLQSHHGGKLGQAPQINLTQEVAGLLPFTNMPNGTWGGNYTGLSFQPAAYTLQTSDYGTVVELAAAATTNVTWRVPDGTFVGAAFNLVNQSNFNLTVAIAVGSSAQFLGVGVPLGTSFVIPAGGNAEIVWGSINWRVNNFSGAYGGVGMIGSFSGVSFQNGNYTTVAGDAGSLISLASGATTNSVFTIIDGGFVGEAITYINQSNFKLTLQIAGGSSAMFVGTGVPLGTTLLLPPGGAVQIVWGGVNWRVPYYSPTGAGNYLTATGHSSNYTIVNSDMGSLHLFGSGAPANVVISVPNGQNAGDTLVFFNESPNNQIIKGTVGATGFFLGQNLPASCTQFNFAPGAGAIMVWGGLNWLVLTQPGVFSSTSNLTATSGWHQYPDGTIEQWGRGTLVAGTLTITWPVAFPNGPYTASFEAGPTATALNTAAPVCPDQTTMSTTTGNVFGTIGSTQTFWWRVKGN